MGIFKKIFGMIDRQEPKENSKTHPIDRTKIPAEDIDEAQRISASPSYCSQIIETYYYDYPIKPFISKDRELHTNWTEQVTRFPDSLVKRENMMQFSDGLLPGHVYMLYWLSKYNLNRRIPAYFEYEYGIEFMTELQWLKAEGFIDKFNKPTQRGKQSIQEHLDVIEKKRGKQKDLPKDTGTAEPALADEDFLQWLTSHGVKLTEEDKKAMGLDKKSIKENKRFREENAVQSAMSDDVLKAMQYEKDGDLDNAIPLYERCVTGRFLGNHPYDRLAIIYRKQKRYEDEKRVLLTAIDVFSQDAHSDQGDRKPKLDRFKERLAKLEKLSKKQ